MKLITRKSFTLIELMAVMAVVSIMILVSFQFFFATQNTWNLTEAKRSTFEDSRIALDIIARDIECAYYGNGSAPFWHWKGTDRPADWGIYRNELLAFVSETATPPNSECTSTLCEVKYQLHYATNSKDNNMGWIKRSVTGNKFTGGADNPKWNFIDNFTVGYTTSVTNGIPVAAFTANSISSENYQQLIPYVLDLSFTCATGTEGENIILPDTTTSDSPDACETTAFPTVVTISITMMDQANWQKWLLLQGTNVYPENETTDAKNFREAHQITFTRMVFLSNRGQ